VVAKWSGEVLSHYFTLTIFGNLKVFFVSFLLLYHCFVILIKYSRAQRGKRLLPPIISPSVVLELKGYLSDLRFSFVFALWKLYKTSLKEKLKLNGLGHSLTLGANHLLWVIGVGFQLYGQLKKSPHNSTGVLGSTAVLTASQATRLGKGSSVTVLHRKWIFCGR